ncbi:MAG TPA: fibronectin type III domain-containing protein [Candidatus Coatesbacteria bacterium]|nr:fibronectin type III domain-containing protein [Candidatus Coatesbacteria bacterium]
MKPHTGLLFVVATLALAVLAGCDIDILGISSQGRIGPEGGEISAYGVSLIFEPGDLPWEITVRMSRWNNPKPLPDGFTPVGTPVKISPFGQMVNGSYEIRWDASDFPPHETYFIFLWDTVNADYHLVGVGHDEPVVTGFAHFIHNLVLAAWTGEGSGLSSGTGPAASFSRPQSSAGPFYGKRAAPEITVEVAGSDGRPLSDVRIDVGLRPGSPLDGWHLAAGDEIRLDDGLSYQARDDFQADQTWTTDSSGFARTALVAPDADNPITNGAGTPIEGLVFRLDLYREGRLVIDNYCIYLLPEYGERGFSLRMPVLGNYQHGDPTDDGEGEAPREQPRLLAPEDGEVLDTPRPTFLWSPVYGADRYRLFLLWDAHSGVYYDIADDATYTLKEREELEPGREYAWTVWAGNANGFCRESSEWRSFTVGDDTGEPPEAPELIYPEDGRTDVELRPTFRWTETKRAGGAPFEARRPGPLTRNVNPPSASAVQSNPTSTLQQTALTAQGLTQSLRQSAGGCNPPSPAESYRIQVDDEPGFGSPEIDESGITDDRFTPSDDLEVQTRYYWRVRAGNRWGDGPWSTVWSFTTGGEQPPRWHIEVVDSAGNVGEHTSLALDSSGRPHISYYDGSGKTLKYARWTGSQWQVETVDSAGAVGRHTSLALDGSGNAHISYHDADNGQAKYARWRGSAWQLLAVDAAYGKPTSLALDPSGWARISYQGGAYDLLYARWDGASWQLQTVDADGNVGDYSSLALDPSGNPCISYQDLSNNALKYARWTGSQWQVETVDPGGYVGRQFTSLALDSAGRPRISYYSTRGELRCARWTGDEWLLETVDSAGNVGLYTSLVLDGSGNPHISYFDLDKGDLKYARWTGGSWVIETVDTGGIVGGFTSLALDSDGNPHISYYDFTNGDLKYAHWR